MFMHKHSEILSSVVEITRQRDKDSLEFSLVATLAEIVPVTKVSFYRTINEIGIESLEEVVRLDTSKNEKGDLEFLWQVEAPIVKAKGVLKECWLNKSFLTRTNKKNTETTILVPMHKNEDVIGILMLSSDKPLDDYKSIVEGFVKIYENHLYILSESEHDTLTGLLNRRSFDSRLSKLLELQKTKDSRLEDERRKENILTSTWIVQLDIDDFKRVNDTFGHMYGDEVLLLLSQMMRSTFRQTDLLFRFGGEEFVIVLAPTRDEDTFFALERFRQKVADFHFPQVGQVTISIGCAEIQPGDYPPTVLDRADKAMYYAKTNGRNQVCHYETLLANGDIVEQRVIGDVELF